MPRQYGQIMSAIWNDQDFRALTGSAQRAYLMLITQADITSAGTLALTVKRWGKYACDTPWDELSDWLSELHDARFIVADWDTEEVLVRKFVKWDGGATNPKRRPAIVAAAEAVVSQRIRCVLAVELDALGIANRLSVDSLSDRHPDTPRVLVTEVLEDPEPESLTLNPESGNPDQPSSSADADVDRLRPEILNLCRLLADCIEQNGSKRPPITQRWRDACRLMLDRDGRTAEQIENAIRWCQQDEFWRSNILSMPTLRKQYDRLRLAAQRGTQSTADRNVRAGVDLAQRLRAREQQADRLELTDGRHAS